MRRQHHSTQELLIDAAIALLDETSAEHITTAQILERAGVSRSSLYYFFDDVGELLEEATGRRFSAVTEATIAAIDGVLATSNSTDDFFAGLNTVTLASQSVAWRSRRLERASMMARTATNERLRSRLADMQVELTTALAERVGIAQERGFIDATMPPVAVATFIQAYAFGRLVDDVSATPMTDSEWSTIVGSVVLRAFAPR